MDFDANSILFGGFSAVVILVFLVQTIRESTNLPNNQVPLVSIILGLTMFLGTYFLPEDAVDAIATGLMVAAAASFTVRYVKNGEQDQYVARSSSARGQGNDLAPTRVSRSEREI